MRQLREAVADAFRNAICEVFQVWIGAGVDKRQDRHRIDRFAGRGEINQAHRCDHQDRQSHKHRSLVAADLADQILGARSLACASNAPAGGGCLVRACIQFLLDLL